MGLSVRAVRGAAHGHVHEGLREIVDSDVEVAGLHSGEDVVDDIHLADAAVESAKLVAKSAGVGLSEIKDNDT